MRFISGATSNLVYTNVLLRAGLDSTWMDLPAEPSSRFEPEERRRGVLHYCLL